MRFSGIGSIIFLPTQNTLKIALFRECLNGISNKDRHRQQLLTFLPCSDTSRLFRLSLSVRIDTDTDTDTGSFIGLLVLLSVWLWQLALMFLYSLFLCITEITLYYTVLHTHFLFILCFFSLSEYLFYNQFMYYTKLHGITSYIALSILKLYISLFWYLKYWKCRSCINFVSI